MSTNLLLLVIFVLTGISYLYGSARARAASNDQPMHSRPRYHGYLTAIGCAVPALAVVAAWLLLQPMAVTSMTVNSLPPDMQQLPPGRLNLIVNDIKNLAAGAIPLEQADDVRAAAAQRYQGYQQIFTVIRSVLALVAGLVGALLIWRNIRPSMRARAYVERAIMVFLIACSCLAIFTTMGIVLSVLFESLRFFGKVPFTEFVFGLHWSPQTAIRADQVGSSGSFGAVPIFAGTLLISAIAMLVAVPLGLMSAIYLAEYASESVRSWVKPLLEILAGIPTVVYGFFAALTVAPLIRSLGESVGLSVASESALAAGLVMGIMIIPFVSSLSDDVITAVPQSLRDGSLGLGATKSETIKRVVIPAALPGIVGGVLLAVSRAIGETMIVVMAAGLAANLTINPLEAVTTVTVQIVTLLTGDQAFDSPKTLAAFALGLMLFVTTLLLNVLALHVVRKYREQYE